MSFRVLVTIKFFSLLIIKPVMQKNQNIYLIGFMGAGKSTIAPLLAKKMQRAFFDTDEWIKNYTGQSITAIFQQHGEDYFRELERQSVQLVTKMTDMVIALGGGAVLKSENWILLKETGFTIYLKCSPQQILNRINNYPESRPLLAGSENQKLNTIISLLTEREIYYSRADLTVTAKSNETTETFVNRIHQKLEGFI